MTKYKQERKKGYTVLCKLIKAKLDRNPIFSVIYIQTPTSSMHAHPCINFHKTQAMFNY